MDLEGVAEFAEEPGFRRAGDLPLAFPAAQLGELAQQRLLLGGQPRRGPDEEVDGEVAAGVLAQGRSPRSAQGHGVSLDWRADADVDPAGAVEGLSGMVAPRAAAVIGTSSVAQVIARRWNIGWLRNRDLDIEVAGGLLPCPPLAPSP